MKNQSGFNQASIRLQSGFNQASNRQSSLILMLCCLFSSSLWAQCPTLVSNNAVNCSTGDAVYTIDNYGATLSAVSISATSGFSYSTASINATSGTFTLTGVTITNYKDFGSFTATLTIGGVSCVYSCKVAECCPGSPTYDYLYIDETIPSGSYTGEVWFYGDIGLQGITEFNSAQIYSATDAQLEVLTGGDVTVDNSTCDKLCEYAWDGFYISDASSSLTFSSSTVKEAIRAVHTKSNGEVVALSSTFSDNIVSIYVDAHTSTGPYFSSSLSLSDNLFTFTRSFNSFNTHPSSTISLAKFFDGDCSQTASGYSAPVFIDGNSIWVNIGHKSLLENTFEDPSAYAADITWINIRESQVQIRNNDVDDANMAICADNNSKVIIGGANALAGNTIGTAVRLYNSAGHVENTAFNEANLEIVTPVHLLVGTGYPSIGTYIYKNTFTDCRLDVTGNVSSNTQVRIIDNDFPDSYVRLYDFASNTNGRLIFNDNSLTGVPAFGSHLTVYECDGMVIGNNVINNGSTTTLTGATSPIGMDLHTLQDAEITKNTIINCERGAELDGTCTGTLFTCNRFRDNYYGIYLDNPYMSDQGSPGNPLSNYWITSLNKRTAGSSFNTIDWYYSTQPAPPINGTDFRPNIAGGASNVTYHDELPVANLDCPSITPPSFKYAGNSFSEYHSSERPLEDLMENKNSNPNNISVFPNPSNGLLNIQLPPKYIGSQINVYDATGVLIYKSMSTATLESLNLSDLSSGVYLIKLGEYSARFIIQQ